MIDLNRINCQKLFRVTNEITCVEITDPIIFILIIFFDAKI